MSDTGRGDELSVLDFAIALAKHKKLIVLLPIIASLATLVIGLLLPNVYTATVRILPPQQKESSAAAVLSSLAGVSGTAGLVGQALGVRNPNDLYVGILNGHTISDRLIERFDLKKLYEVDTVLQARKALADVTRITSGKDGLIAVEVEDTDPERAARIANAYIEELDHLMQGLAVTEASQRRLFFEQHLAKAQDELFRAEAELREAIEAKGIAGVDAQSRAIVSTAEQLRAQIAVKEIQLDAMRAFATERNPEAVRLRQEIASMRDELSSLESGRRFARERQSPTGLESLHRLRRVKFLEFSVELLTKQLEIARIDEAKDAVLIQVVDRALPPDYKSKPKIAVMTIVAGVAAAIFAMLLAVVWEVVRSAMLNPANASHFEVLFRHLRSR